MSNNSKPLLYNENKKRIATLIRTVCTVINPTLTNCIRYRMTYRVKCNLHNPKTLSEKMLWIKLNVYWNCPIIKKCGDKYEIRKYLSELGYNSLLPKVYAIWDKKEDIDFSLLPNQFVLKPNYGAKNGVVCLDKSRSDIKWLENYCFETLKNKFWRDHRNFDGDAFHKHIIVEELIHANNKPVPDDYKIYCFNGVPIAICYVNKRFSDDGQKEYLMSPSWTCLDNSIQFHSIQKPIHLHEMLEFAKAISSPFPMVRVDLYDTPEKFYFGELTFSPYGCIGIYEVPIHGKPMGDYLRIPNQKEIRTLMAL